MTWIDVLWQELEDMSLPDQVVESGEIITSITRNLLPALARHRRVKVVEILAQPDWDPIRLAEVIGSRRNTITRLAEEGRSLLKSERPE